MPKLLVNDTHFRNRFLNTEPLSTGGLKRGPLDDDLLIDDYDDRVDYVGGFQHQTHTKPRKNDWK